MTLSKSIKIVTYRIPRYLKDGAVMMKKKILNPDDFSNEQGNVLLDVARNKIAEQLGQKYKKPDVPYDDIFESCRGTFVTLKINNQLRGCIGNLEPTGNVVDGVERNAINAAFNDHRFSPLSEEEFIETEIEISILTEPVPLAYKTADDLLSKLRPNIDGVIIKKGFSGATFLPQVWEQLPEPVHFLEHLCQKAGLSKNAWKDGKIEISTYQVQYFTEK